MGTTISCFRIVVAAQRDHSSDMTRLFERLATTPRMGEKPTLKFNDEDARPEVNGKVEEKRDNKDREFEENGEAEEEPDEAEEATEMVEYEKPKRLRRSSSLKTDKTQSQTPRRKKMVRFADKLGLDLVDVRTFLAGIPKIPSSAYSDLIYDKTFPEGRSRWNFWGTGAATFTTPSYVATIPRSRPNGRKLDRILSPSFQQPGSSATFLDQVSERLVCLENVVLEDPINLAIHGTVRVRNLDFQKSVHIRYTLDSWRNFNDSEAIYVLNDSDVTSDKFNFHLNCDALKIGQKLELAVRFRCKGSEYWDNNGGANYSFRCLPALPNNINYIAISTNVTAPQLMLDSAAHECSATFY